jgi:hypothetical protein
VPPFPVPALEGQDEDNAGEEQHHTQEPRTCHRPHRHSHQTPAVEEHAGDLLAGHRADVEEGQQVERDEGS